MIDQSNFSEYMEESLYGENGFYTLGNGAGRSRDYITSPEVGDLFGRIIATYIDDWYNKLESEEPATVIDVGCGPGSLAASVSRAHMANAEMIDYVLVDRSPVHLQTCEKKLTSIESVFTWHTSQKIPKVESPTLVIANELFDNLVFNIARTRDVYKEFKPDEMESSLLAIDTYAYLGNFKSIDNLKGGDVPKDISDFRIPQHVGIASWFEQLSEATSNVGSLSLLVFDYMKSVTEMEDENWMRLYANNQRIVGVDNVLEALEKGVRGDITTDIVKEDLHVLLDIEGFSKVRFENQATWLLNQGIDALSQTLASEVSTYDKLRTWVDDNQDGTAQDFSTERNILLDETGLGAFTVVEAKREV